MNYNEDKMVEEIVHLRSILSTVTHLLDSVLKDGLPAKGRGQDEKESIEIWWEDRWAAIKRAEEALKATDEYTGIVVR